MKFKLDGPEFKFRALEFFTTTHLVKTKYRAISIILYLLTITPPLKTLPKSENVRNILFFVRNILLRNHLLWLYLQHNPRLMLRHADLNQKQTTCIQQ